MTLMDEEQQAEAGIQVDFLAPEGAEAFTRLVRRCYGDSYDAAWVKTRPRWPSSPTRCS